MSKEQAVLHALLGTRQEVMDNLEHMDKETLALVVSNCLSYEGNSIFEVEKESYLSAWSILNEIFKTPQDPKLFLQFLTRVCEEPRLFRLTMTDELISNPNFNSSHFKLVLKAYFSYYQKTCNQILPGLIAALASNSPEFQSFYNFLLDNLSQSSSFYQLCDRSRLFLTLNQQNLLVTKDYNKFIATFTNTCKNFDAEELSEVSDPKSPLFNFYSYFKDIGFDLQKLL